MSGLRLAFFGEKRSMRQTLVVAVLLVTVALASAQKETGSTAQHASVEQIIRKLDEERIQAQIHADAAVLDRLYADDFIGVGPSGTVRTKPQVRAEIKSFPLEAVTWSSPFRPCTLMPDANGLKSAPGYSKSPISALHHETVDARCS
jgi:hypothetical protein